MKKRRIMEDVATVQERMLTAQANVEAIVSVLIIN
jgi:hypothetical protein